MRCFAPQNKNQEHKKIRITQFTEAGAVLSNYHFFFSKGHYVKGTKVLLGLRF
uniref:Uncharacterized protein n=1 Tax=Anguilla anguilla TaxID=7936 RepID=A0A0E9T7R3_ANGAN